MRKNTNRKTTKTKLIIADDHAILRAGVKLLLEGRKEFKIIGEAETGKEALEKCLVLKPDILLLDITLPDMSGIEAARKITKLAPDIKILVLTMHETEEYVKELLKIGVKGYVVKKAADRDLIDAVCTVASGSIYIHSTIAQVLREQPKVALSSREREVIAYLAKGFVNKEIAEQLGISVKTVETYRSRIMQKLNLTRRSELTVYAVKMGLL